MSEPTPDFVPLGVADILLSRLCFGTGTLFRLHSSRERQRLLDAAYGCGIRHFDTARSYGLGAAEREVGRFLARHRGGVTVATKFGIRVSSAGRLLRPLQTVVRRAVGMFPGLLRRIRRHPPPIVSPRCFDLVSARESLEQSLRDLGVERIDMLFLHEPDDRSAIAPDLADWLAAAADAGRIRAWGLSGPLSEILAVRTWCPRLGAVMQYADDSIRRIGMPPAPPGPRITYSPFARALVPIVEACAASNRAADAWIRNVDMPPGRESVAQLLLADSCAAPGGSPVVFSTTSVRHLESLVHAAYDPGLRQRLGAFRGWIADHVAVRGEI